ncbi:MAG: hypothetical protein P8172_13505 [Gammaproteobacteria bacterium]
MTDNPDLPVTDEDDMDDTIERQMDTSGVTGVMQALREDGISADDAESGDDFGETTVVLPSHIRP